ncbi:fibronectin type III domain-containing protein [bacterium]|nr:fibronectin type III domain-containing protein [bacterium]
MSRNTLLIVCIFSALAALYGCSSSTSNNSVDVTSPPVPAELTIKSMENGTVFLTWSPVKDDELKGYYVYWNEGAEVDTLTSHKLFSESANAAITGLKSDITYYFAVSSIDESDNESSLSVQVTGKYQDKNDTTPPPVPLNLQLSAIGNGSASLVWTPITVDDLKGYNVYWRGGAKADPLSANRKFVENSSVTIINLDYEIIYYFAVSAVDKNGNESALSNQVNGKPLNTTSPSPPANINISAVNDIIPKINVFWSENTEPDIKHYNIYRAQTSTGLEDSSSSYVTSVTQEYYVDVNVEVGVRYYYRISAVDKENWESTPSSIVSDLVLPPVSLVSPINYQYIGDHPQFTWEPVEGATKYVLFLTSSRIGGEIWYTEVNKNTTQVTYAGNVTLISGNTYYWRVGAITIKEINSESTIGTFVVNTGGL